MDSETYQRASLRRHLGIDNIAEGPGLANAQSRPTSPSPVSFFVERSPPSDKPARCALTCCSSIFVSGCYRIAVTPAMNRDAVQNAGECKVSRIFDISNKS